MIVGWNDLATLAPALAAQLVDPRVAETLTYRSSKSVRWFCDGTADNPHPRREWSASVNDRSKGIGCAACSGKAALPGWNDLATVNPELAAQLVDPRVARTVTRGSKQSLRWFCEGTAGAPHPRHEWSATVNNRSSGGGCPACVGKAVIVGWNDLATADPELAAQLVDPSIAQALTRSSNKAVRWFCGGTLNAPHPRIEWTTVVNNRSNGTGCPVCASSGFDPSKPGWLYLLRHDLLDMHQIGISNDLEVRVRTHARSGWQVIEVRKFDDGALCAATERAALAALRIRGARLGRSGDHMAGKFDGFTEAWPTSSLEVTGLQQLLEWIRHDEWDTSMTRPS